MQQTLSKLAPPKNQMSHLLYDMIKGKMIAETQYRMNGFRTRLSELRVDYGVTIFHVDEPFTNEFGRKSYFRSHFITQDDRQQAMETYLKINL